MGKERLWAVWLLALGMALSTTPDAAAAEGVLEINSACVVSGCFPGDAGGFPVTITGEAGLSYRLTDNLTLGTVDTTGILISGSYITIDLAGHRIAGPVVCEGMTTKFDGSGSGDAIAVDSEFGNVGVSVRNGTVSGAGQNGLKLGVNAQVTDVHAISNGMDGIYVGAGSIIRGSFGIRNGDEGIEVVTASVIVDSMAQSNVDDGIRAAAGSTVSRCISFDNEQIGIVAGAGTIVESSSMIANGGVALFFLTATGGYRGNVMDLNGGTVTSGVDLGGNLCDGGACP